jgi:hypothetical protein
MRVHPRKWEHLINMLHDGCRTVSLEASPCSPEPREETQKKTQRTVKLSEEYAEKQENQRCRRNISGGTRMERMGHIKHNIL